MEIARDAMGLPPSRYPLDPVLKELSFGAWEGLTWPEIEARDPKGVRTRNEDKWSFVPPGGESYAMLAERLRPWLDGLSGDAFVVSHGGVARALMTLIAGVPPAKAADAPIVQGRALVLRERGLSLDHVTTRSARGARLSRAPARGRGEGDAQAAFMLTVDFAILVRSWSVSISSCSVSSRSFAASLKPSSLAQVLSVP